MADRSCLAFTLVELLVVIAVIALLIALLMPALEAARRSAHVAQCSSNLRQICIATELYTHDFRGYFPAKHLGWSPNTNSGHVFCMMYGDPNVSVPPSGDGRIVNPYANLPAMATLGSEAFALFKCPGDEGPIAVHPFDPTCWTTHPEAAHELVGTSYNYNAGPPDVFASMTFSDSSLNVSWARQGLWCKTIDKVKRPELMVMNHEIRWYYAAVTWPGWCDGAWRSFHDERLSFDNMGFVDGHVELIFGRDGPDLYQNDQYSFEWH